MLEEVLNPNDEEACDGSRGENESCTTKDLLLWAVGGSARGGEANEGEGEGGEQEMEGSSEIAGEKSHPERG